MLMIKFILSIQMCRCISRSYSINVRFRSNIWHANEPGGKTKDIEPNPMS